MLKLVKKIERKQYIQFRGQATLKNTELTLLTANPVHVNTGQYRTLAVTGKKIQAKMNKQESQSIEQGRRPSVFREKPIQRIINASRGPSANRK